MEHPRKREREDIMNQTITVCSECLRACCWHGNFMCDKAYGAGTVEKTREELERLDLEHPSYWDTEA